MILTYKEPEQNGTADPEENYRNPEQSEWNGRPYVRNSGTQAHGQ